MTTQVFSIYDRAIEAYGPLMCGQAVGVVLRWFGDECNREGSQYAGHPEDYELFVIAHFDETTGVLTPHSKPRLVQKASDLVRK